MIHISKYLIGFSFALALSCTLSACSGKSQQQNTLVSEASKENDINADSIIITTISSDTIQTEEETRDYEDEWIIARLEASPEISESDVKKLQPYLKKWLNYHELDLKEARDAGIQEGIVKYNSLDSSSLYFREYTIEDDVSDSPLFDYSPNKRKYVSLGIIADKEDDGYFYYYGWDDCQAVYLTDRDKKQNYMIAWEGSSSLNIDIFWIDNNNFVLVGEDFYINTHFFRVFDLNRKTIQSYNIIDKRTEENKRNNYFEDVYLKKKNIRVY